MTSFSPRVIKEEANAHLLNHLKEDADEEAVREVFRIASVTSTAGVLRSCSEVCTGVCSLTCRCCVTLHVLYLCFCKQMSVYCKQDPLKSSVCLTLHSLPLCGAGGGRLQ